MDLWQEVHPDIIEDMDYAERQMVKILDEELEEAGWTWEALEMFEY